MFGAGIGRHKFNFKNLNADFSRKLPAPTHPLDAQLSNESKQHHPVDVALERDRAATAQKTQRKPKYAPVHRCVAVRQGGQTYVTTQPVEGVR